MSFNYIFSVDLDNCIGNSLGTFNENFTSLDLNIKQLSSSVEIRTNFLSSETQTFSAKLSNDLTFYNFLSSSPNSSVAVMNYAKDHISYDSIDTGIIAGGTGATLAQSPNTFTSGGSKRGKYVTDFQKNRTIIDQVASSDYSVILNGTSNTISGTQAEYGFIGNGDQNMIMSRYSNILCGIKNNISNSYSICYGIANNNIKGSNCSLYGINNTNSFTLSATSSPATTASTGSGSFVFGSNGVSYYENQGVYSNGKSINTNGSNQNMVFVLKDVTNNSIKVKHLAPIAINNFNVTYPNFIPAQNRTIWNMKINAVAVTSAGDVSTISIPSFIIRKDNSGLLESLSGQGIYIGTSPSTKITLSILSNFLVALDVEQTDTKSWYWTAVVETVQSIW